MCPPIVPAVPHCCTPFAMRWLNERNATAMRGADSRTWTIDPLRRRLLASRPRNDAQGDPNVPSTLHRTGAALALALAASLAVPTAASAATPAPTPATTSTSSKAVDPAASDRDRGTVTTPDGRTFITDDQGRALQLRGFNAGKWQNDRVTAGDVAAMADQGFNFLRLIVQWEYFEPEQGHYDEAYFDYVESVLDAADREGVHVMLDLHQDVYGPAFGHGGIPAWATRTDGLPYEMDPSNWFNDY